MERQEDRIVTEQRPRAGDKALARLAYCSRRMRIVPLNDLSSTLAAPVLCVPNKLLLPYKGETERLRGLTETSGSVTTLPRTVLALKSNEAEGGVRISISPL